MSGIPPPRMSAPVEGYSAPPKSKMPIGWLIVILVVGGCGGLTLVLSAILFPVFAQARRMGQSAGCMRNLQNISSSMYLYCTENDEHYPVADHWMDSLAKTGLRPRFFRCPSVGSLIKNTYGFAMNKEVSGKSQSQVKYGTPVVFDSVLLNRNAVSDLSTLPRIGRHRYKGKDVSHVLLVGGSVINR